MSKKLWDIDSSGVGHTVKINHNHLTGKRRVWVDDEIIVDERRLKTTRSIYRFSVDEKTCELFVTTSGNSYEYCLFMDGEFIDPSGGREKRSRAAKHIIELYDYWKTVADSFGLEKIEPIQVGQFTQERLIGKVNGFICMVGYLVTARAEPSEVVILVRYAQSLDIEAVKKKLTEDPAWKSLFGKYNPRLQNVQIENQFIFVRIPYNMRKNAPDIVVEKITNIISLIAKYFRVLPEQCENDKCSRVSQSIKLVLINSILKIACEECIGDISKQIQKARKAYEERPSRLLLSSLVGLVTAFLGGIIFSMIGVYLGRVVLFLSAFWFTVIYRIMVIVGKKYTTWNIILAAIFAFGSYVWGYYLLIYSFIQKEVSYFINSKMLQEVWVNLWHDPIFLVGLYVNIIFVGINAIIYWRNKKSVISRMFDPNVEVLDIRL